MSPRYGRDALLRRDGQTYGAPRTRHRIAQGRGAVRVVLGKHTAFWYGAGMRAVLENLAVRRMYDHDRRCWACPIGEADNVIGFLRNVQLRLVEIEEIRR